MKKEILDQLPVYEKSACKDCGASDYDSCNIDKDGKFHQCNKCHVYDESLKALVRKDLQ